MKVSSFSVVFIVFGLAMFAWSTISLRWSLFGLFVMFDSSFALTFVASFILVISLYF
jgi:hypothetical protein